MSRLDTERAIIGCLLSDIQYGMTNRWNHKQLHANHFSNGICRVVYAEIEKVHNWIGKDMLYVSNVTGLPMSELSEFDMPTSAHLSSYIAQLHDYVVKDTFIDNTVNWFRKAMLIKIDRSELTRADIAAMLKRMGEGLI
jgi:hypothetical protein